MFPPWCAPKAFRADNCKWLTCSIFTSAFQDCDCDMKLNSSQLGNDLELKALPDFKNTEATGCGEYLYYVSHKSFTTMINEKEKRPNELKSQPSFLYFFFFYRDIIFFALSTGAASYRSVLVRIMRVCGWLSRVHNRYVCIPQNTPRRQLWGANVDNFEGPSLAGALENVIVNLQHLMPKHVPVACFKEAQMCIYNFLNSLWKEFCVTWARSTSEIKQY